ncbi:MAG: peptidylprolyl isomerase [Gallionella sp.]
MKSITTRNIQSISLTFFLGGMLLCAGISAAKPIGQPGAKKPTSAFATVGNTVITWQDYKNAYVTQSSNKFYHAKPTEDALAAFQREVGNKLIDDTLIVQEAKRRKVKPDNEAVKQEIQKYEQRFANDPKWPTARPRVLPIITRKLQNENIRNKLEKLVRDVPPPTGKQLREYYDAHPAKFTSPPQPRISVILLKVDPSSTGEEWQKATEEATGLVKRIRAGEDFATLARDYSGDPTAEEGGDMGYLHTGMLPGLPEETVSKLQPGETSDPVKLLEGVAIFRLVDRIQPPASSFEASKDRVKELWLSEQSDAAWSSLIAKLKKKTPIHMDESRFLPLPTAQKIPVKPTENTTIKPAENEGATSPTTK